MECVCECECGVWSVSVSVEGGVECVSVECGGNKS